MLKKEGLLVVVSGPSGVGKGTVVREVLEKSGNIRLSVSATTREKRAGEVDGLDYHFYGREEFMQLASSDQMLEYAVYCGNYYGTPAGPIRDWLQSGLDVLLEIEVEGAKQIKEKVKDCVTVFLLPPSLDVLRKRLELRGTEGQERLNLRIRRAMEEIKEANFYDYLVVNDDIFNAAADVLSIIKAEKLKTSRIGSFLGKVLKDQNCER